MLHEHPAGTLSWTAEQAVELISNPAMGSVVRHQRMYGQKAQADGGTWLPARKATRWMSSAMEILARLGHKCRGGRRHQALVGGRAAPAAVYPPQLRKAILRGAEAHTPAGR